MWLCGAKPCLARHVLEGKTKGYRNHPQLNRFKQKAKPIDSINQYLTAVYEESLGRNFNFDKEKVVWDFEPSSMNVTTGQMKYETTHLLNKLKIRDKEKYNKLHNLKKIEQHPMFVIVNGPIEIWEKT